MAVYNFNATDSNIYPLFYDTQYNAENFLTSNPSQREIFCSTYRQQHFPFRNSLINYITSNVSSSNLYEKLVKTCKYFFINNPVLVISNFEYQYSNNRWLSKFNGTEVDINKLLSKIWIKDKLEVINNLENCDDQYFFTFTIPQLWTINFKKLTLFDQNIFFKDLHIIASNCEDISLCRVIVETDDGSVVALEYILEALTSLKSFSYEMQNTALKTCIIKPETVCELLKIPHFLNLTSFFLDNIPDVFDINYFYDYIKKNKQTNICLDFSDQISEEYKTRLKFIADEIFEKNQNINVKNRDFKIPLFSLAGNYACFKKLCKLRNQR